MIGIAITAILSTILGYGICAMMVIAKESEIDKESDKAMTDEEIKRRITILWLYYFTAPKIGVERGEVNNDNTRIR